MAAGGVVAVVGRRACARSRPTSSSPPTRSTVVVGFAARRVLLDSEVRRGERGDLGQVGDADHLAALGRGGAGARRQRARCCRRCRRRSRRRRASRRDSPRARPVSASMIRESSPPDAASLSGESGIPGFVATRNSTVSAPLAPKPSGCGSSATSSRAPLHRQLARARRRRARRAPRRPAPRRRSARRRSRARPASASPSRGLELAATLLGVLEFARSRARQRSACSITASIEPPCFRFRRSNAVEPLLDHLEPAGFSVEPVEVGAKLGGERRRARPRPTPARSAERVELGVDAIDRRRARLRRAERRARRRRRPRPRRLSAAERPRRGLAQALGVAQALALRGRAPRASSASGVGGLDLGELEAQQVEVALARALALTQLGQLAPASAPTCGWARAVAVAQLELLVAREPVEDLELGARPGSACGARAGRRRRAGASRAPAGPAAEAARPATNALVRPRGADPRARGRSPRRPRASARRSRPARDRRAALRGASKTPSTHASSAPGRTIWGRALPPSSRSSEWASTVLPGAGLAGDRVQALAEAKLGPLDQQQVLDPQLVQHAPVLATGADGFAAFARRRRRGRLGFSAARRPNFSRMRR